MRSGLPYLASLFALLPLFVSADELSQTDWSAGPGIPGPSNEWGAGFTAASNVSWRAVPGQIALSSLPLDTPLEDRLDDSFAGGISVYSSDIDGDGDTDIVGSAYYTDDVELWINEGGEPVVWSEHTIDGDFTDPCEVYAADVDGDGLNDILGSAYGGALISWWRNDGGSPSEWVEQAIRAGYHGAHDVWAGDLDGDGDTDVVGVAAEDDEITWWRNDGGAPIQWHEQIIDDEVDYPCRVEAVDIDGDSHLDILATSWLDAEVAWWRNAGGEPISWDKQTIRTNYTGTHGIHGTDLDDDGDIDVLGAAMNLSDITVWWNEGGDPIAWTEQVIDGGFEGAGYVYSHDIDGDGDLDVVGSSWGSGGIAWWQNDGDGGTWTKHSIIQGVGQTSSVYADDVDGDGDIDILGTGFDAGFISWWQVTSFVSEGELTSTVLDLGETEQLSRIEWECVDPSDSSLRFQVRCSDDPSNMGQWSTDITAPTDLEGPAGRYVQYKTILETDEESVSPILKEVCVFSEPAGIGGGEQFLPERLLHNCIPNPSSGTSTIEFTLPNDSHVELGLFDAAGRQVCVLANATYSAGPHKVMVSSLRPGMYVCLMDAGGRRSSRQLVIVP
jgi:hypothetical protein